MDIRENDYTAEQIAKIKRDFRLEKISSPRSHGEKIDLGDNLLAVQGIVFSGVITVAVEEDLLFINEFKFDLINGPMIPRSKAALDHFNQRFAQEDPKCRKINDETEKKLEMITKDAFSNNLAVEQKNKEIQKKLEGLSLQKVKVSGGHGVARVCYENLPCEKYNCIRYLERSDHDTSDLHNSNPDDLNYRDKNMDFNHRTLIDRINNLRLWLKNTNGNPRVISMNREGSLGCPLSEGIELIKIKMQIFNAHEKIDKNLLLELNVNALSCLGALSNIYAFANSEEFLSSAKKALEGMK